MKQLGVVEIDWLWNQKAIHRAMLKAGLIWYLLFFLWCKKLCYSKAWSLDSSMGPTGCIGITGELVRNVGSQAALQICWIQIGLIRFPGNLCAHWRRSAGLEERSGFEWKFRYILTGYTWVNYFLNDIWND